MASESTVVNHRFELTAGTHMCCMYRGPAERDELLEPYLAEGLWAGETCFVAVGDEDPRRLRRLQATGGPGRLIIRTAAEPVFDKDFFDIDRIIAFWEKTITDALGVEGVAFVRLSAEATWWLTQIPGQEDLLRYEARLNDFAARHPVSVLCLYDIEELGAGVVFDAMKIHPRIWLSGLVLENPLMAFGALGHRAWNPPTSLSLADDKARALPLISAGSRHGGARFPTVTPGPLGVEMG